MPYFFWNTGFQENKRKSDEVAMYNGLDYESDVDFYMMDPCDVFKSDKPKPVKLHRLAQVLLSDLRLLLEIGLRNYG